MFSSQHSANNAFRFATIGIMRIGGNCMLTRSIQDSETSIDFVQGLPGSRLRERVNSSVHNFMLKLC